MIHARVETQLYRELTDASAAWESAVPPSIFSTYAYARAWWPVFGRGQLLILEAARDASTRLLAPLFADQGMVYFLGSGGSDYLDFSGSSEDPDLLCAVLAEARRLTSDFLGFCFYHLPEGSATIQTLRTVAPALGLTVVEEYSLPAPRLEFAAAKGVAARKKSLVRHENQLRRAGAVTVHHDSGAAAILPHLEAFFEQHNARSAQAGRAPLFHHPAQCRFYRELAACPASKLTRVMFEGKPAAMHFGFVYAGSYLWYKPCFAPELSQFSPGEVLLRQLLLDAEASGCHTFDFGIGDEPFKYRFATSAPAVTSLGLYPSRDMR